MNRSLILSLLVACALPARPENSGTPDLQSAEPIEPILLGAELDARTVVLGKAIFASDESLGGDVSAVKRTVGALAIVPTSQRSTCARGIVGPDTIALVALALKTSLEPTTEREAP